MDPDSPTRDTEISRATYEALQRRSGVAPDSPTRDAEISRAMREASQNQTAPREVAARPAQPPHRGPRHVNRGIPQAPGGRLPDDAATAARRAAALTGLKAMPKSLTADAAGKDGTNTGRVPTATVMWGTAVLGQRRADERGPKIDRATDL